MRTIRIDTNESPYWLYDSCDSWKEYVSGDFDETYVIKGNRELKQITEASWYKRATDIISDFESEVEKEYFTDITETQYDRLKEIVDKCKYSDDFETVIKVLRVIYPEETFGTATIRGYVQRDWQKVLYKVNGADIKLLEAYYFGMVNEVYDETENLCTVVTDDDLWNAERENKVGSLVREVCDIPDDEEIEIYKSDGYIKTTNWVKIQ